MAAFILCGEEVFADFAGALWWPRERLLAFADLHLEKGSYFASKTGQMLPPYDTRATLLEMSRVIDRYAPSRIVCLGDSFHDKDGPARMDGDDRRQLMSFMKGRRFVWIEGNHDASAALVLGGESAPVLSLGPLSFRHEVTGQNTGEVAGHLHPVVQITTRAMRVRRKCFVSDGESCVLPALGAFTGGLDVSDEEFARLFRRGFQVYALGKSKVHALGANSTNASQHRFAPRV